VTPPTPPDGQVAITLRDVWAAQNATVEKIGDVNLTLTRILGQMDAQQTTNGNVTRELADHEGRLRALERWRYALPTATLLGIGSAALAVLGYFHH
jgi:hypothetical protein